MTRSARARAWRNLVVAAINAALERKLLTLDPPQNLWPQTERLPNGRDDPYVFAFNLCGAPALASLSDAGWDEVSVHACYLPTPEGARWIRSSNAGFLAGEAFAASWLERRTARYLMGNGTKSMFWCRRHLIPVLAGLDVAPMGYADHGRVII